MGTCKRIGLLSKQTMITFHTVVVARASQNNFLKRALQLRTLIFKGRFYSLALTISLENLPSIFRRWSVPGSLDYCSLYFCLKGGFSQTLFRRYLHIYIVFEFFQNNCRMNMHMHILNLASVERLSSYKK